MNDKCFEVVICGRCKRIRRYPVGATPPVGCGFQRDEDSVVCTGRLRPMTEVDKSREARKWFYVPRESTE